jgi:hypothetical protein
VRFVEAVPAKRWGDPDFVVKAEASSGLAVSYAADGGCSASGDTVSIRTVGTCTITASQAGNNEWGPATATLAVAIEPAEPKITFEDSTVRFTRTLRVPLWATSDPPIPLRYRIVQTDETFNDEPCAIDGNDFVFPDSPIPQLSSACAIRVEAAEESPNYAKPRARTALVAINFPSWDVEIDPVASTQSFVETGGTITLTIHERSGNAYGMEVEPFGACTFDGAATTGILYADPPPSVPAGTTRYTAEIILLDPATVTFRTCTIEARGFPLDHVGGKSSDSVEFTVVP